MSKKQLKGKIISLKMAKTAVVRVERTKKHPKYKRIFKVHKNYKAHIAEGEYKEGDLVMIEETKPISKDKKWKLVNKL